MIHIFGSYETDEMGVLLNDKPGTAEWILKVRCQILHLPEVISHGILSQKIILDKVFEPVDKNYRTQN